VLKISNSNRKCTKEFKEEAIKRAFSSGSRKHTANNLGISPAILSTWIQSLKMKGGLAKINTNDAKKMAALIEENRRLHKELALAKEERKILKKAAAYFAQHQK